MLKMSWTLSAVLLAASYAVTAPQAKAQQPYLGKFTLPMEARFGSVVLQPGDYTMSNITGTSAIRISGEGGAVTILPSSTDIQARVGRSALTLESVNGGFVLKRLDSLALNRRFDFEVKSSGRDRERAALAQHSSVELALK